MKKNLRFAGVALVVGTLVLGTFGCQGKKEESQQVAKADLPPAKSFLDLPLANKLPPTTYGYFFWDMERDAAKQYAKQVEGVYGADFSWKKMLTQYITAGADTANTALPGAQSPDQAQAQNNAKQQIADSGILDIVDWLDQNGFLPFTPGRDTLVTQGVLFFEMKDDIPLPGIGVYMNTKSGVDVSKKIAEFRQVLGSKGLTTEDVKDGADAAFALNIDAAQQGGATGAQVSEKPAAGLKVYVG
ncbi:MAG: hypothetical protein KDD70_13535, partial [Bdellovibrionales bacterium]|nr:hypothetical protein [Bdellovibrionales bacterium]